LFLVVLYLSKAGAKVRTFFELAKFFSLGIWEICVMSC